MRVPWVPLGSLAVLLLLCLPATGALGEGGIDNNLPPDVYDISFPRPKVVFLNDTFEEGQTAILEVVVSFPNVERNVVVNVVLKLYGWGMYGEERSISEFDNPPFFNDPVDGNPLLWANETIVAQAKETSLYPEVNLSAEGTYGYYRVSVLLEIENGTTAKSMGYFTEQEWKDNIELVRSVKDPSGTDYIVSEGGFTLVPKHFTTVMQPNLVPDFGDFTTPVIRPGEKGKYNFTVTNRYDVPITGVLITVEFYMWATIEDAKPIEDLDGPPPLIEGEGHPFKVISLDSIAPGESKDVLVIIKTKEDTPKGTFFVRHRIEFVYEGETFIMASRGFFTWDQWEGFDYSNLYYQLRVSGIVPDSSFSVKDPVPLWPLATLIVLCVLFGTLAVVFYLAEEHGDQYPRLKKGLQFWTGRWEQRKRLMQQRMDELRGKDWEKGDDRDDGDVDDDVDT